MNKYNKKPQEFSKKILIQTKWLFILQVILVVVFACLDYDTTALCITTTVSGGVYGATVAFYLNKAKTENISKGRLKLAILKTQLTTKVDEGELSEEDMLTLNEEIERLDEQYNIALDNKLDEALGEEITIQNN